MNKPTREGDLTPSQFEILAAIWPKGRCGASVAEIWKVVSQNRDISRTTVLNQVQRLEARGWVYRQEARPNQKGAAMRFVVATGPKRAKMELAKKILEDYFDGSVCDFVISSLGNKRPSSARIAKLLEVLKEIDVEEQDKIGKEEFKLAVQLLTFS